MNLLALSVFLITLGIAPVPYGGVLPNGTLLIEASAFLAAALAFVSRRSDRQSFGSAWFPLAALLLLAGLGAMQLIPLRTSLLRSISPLSARVYADANSTLGLFGRPTISQRISIAPSDTRSVTWLVLACASLFCAGAIVGSSRRRRQIIIGVLLATMIVELVVATTSSGGAERIHGPFVNPNHFAGYLEIGLAFAFGWIWSEILTGSDRGAHVRDRAERVEHRLIHLTWRIVLWATLAAGIVLTRSRGAILAAALTTIVMAGMAFLHGSRSRYGKRTAAAIGFAIATGILFVVISTGEAGILRFLAADPRDINTDTRMQIWRASVSAWRLFPTVGSGLGTFREAFRRVQPAEINGLVEQAHNDFLQILVTGGWIGASLAALAVGSMFLLLLRRWLRQPHRLEGAVALSGLGALLSLTLHGIVEFNMSIPAIPATLAAMLGVSWSAANEGTESAGIAQDSHSQ